MEFEKGKDYAYEQIIKERDTDINEYGNDIIGEGFIVLTPRNVNKTISFILTGVRGNDYIYTCIFNQ